MDQSRYYEYTTIEYTHSTHNDNYMYSTELGVRHVVTSVRDSALVSSILRDFVLLRVVVVVLVQEQGFKGQPGTMYRDWLGAG